MCRAFTDGIGARDPEAYDDQLALSVPLQSGAATDRARG